MKRYIGLLFFAISAGLVIVFPILFPVLFTWLRSLFSKDNQISTLALWFLRLSYFSVPTLFSLAAGMLWGWISGNWIVRIKSVIGKYHLLHDEKLELYFRFLMPVTFFLATLIFILFYLSYVFPTVKLLYGEMGVMETAALVVLLLAILLLLRVIPRVGKLKLPDRVEKLLKLGLIFLAVGLIVIGMEEISWGQWLFGWETNALFSGNLQAEMNLHNYFNPYFNLLYTFTGLILFGIICFSFAFELAGKGSRSTRIILPHPSLIGIGFYFAIPIVGGELFEGLFCILIFAYAARLFLIVQPGNLEKSS